MYYPTTASFLASIGQYISWVSKNEQSIVALNFSAHEEA